jgi:hypothetical protein
MKIPATFCLPPSCSLRWLALAASLPFFSSAPVVATTPEVAPPFAWAASAGGTKNNKVRGVAVDREGNVFVAGEGFGDLRLDSKPDGKLVKGRGELDFFVAKLDPRGRFLWAHLAGGAKTDRGYAVATDAAGNCYVTGHYESADAEFSGTKLPQRGGYDIFVAKYDRAGQLAWIRTAGGKGYDHGHGIAIDGRGDVLICGAVEGDAEFGGVAFPNGNGSRLYCAKYRADGSFVWAKISTGAATGAGQGIAVDAAGNSYVAGHNTGAGKIGQQALASTGGTSATLVKFSSEGEALWVTQQLGAPSFHFHEVACDASGRVWAVGMFRGTVKISGGSFTTASDTDRDALICHYDTAGKLRWSQVGHGPATDYALGVATDGKGNCFVTGEFSASFTLGRETLQTRGSTDIYVAKFDAAGALRWLSQSGGPGSDNAYSIVCDTAGNLVLAGSYVGAAKFDDHVVTSKTRDLFVAKLGAQPAKRP